MKICVLGLDCAAPEILLQDERLVHIRELMRRSIHGRLKSVVPPITVPAWMCMSTSLDPGTLGVYGFRNRADHSYGRLSFVTSRSIPQPAIWTELAQAGKKSIIVGVPPNFPPRRVNGISVGCFLTPDPARDEFTAPSGIGYRLHKLTGGYPVDVKGFRTDDKAWLKEQIFEMSRRQWQAVHWLLREQEWDYFHYVDIGLDRVHHGFWNCFDRSHIHHQPGNPFENVIPDYYLWLDQQIGQVLEVLSRDTVVLVVSDHGAQKLDGGFAVNEWLIREGLLVLNEYPREITPFEKLDVDWPKTKVWSEGGYYARVFFNIAGREPDGTIPAAAYEAFQDEMKARFEALTDDRGDPLGSLVFKPKEIYREVNGVAPDLIVHFGGLSWRSIGTVGRPVLHVQENDTGPDACNHAQFGAFILSRPNSYGTGERSGARLLDIAPTLLQAAGFEPPSRMQGRVLA
jgi:predicted AlkP superfamily phosphohydrolase/phosphomutase